MQKRNRLRGIVFSLFILWSFLLNGVLVKGQDVVVSDDLSGGFTFRSSGKTVQKKTAFRNSSNVKRLKVQKVATTKRIQKQTVVVAKTKPKRTKSKEVNPSVLAGGGFNTKPKEEVSRIFAGAGEYYLDRDQIDKAVEIFTEAGKLDPKNTNAKFGLSEALTRKGDLFLDKENGAEAKKLYLDAIKLNDKNAGAYAGLGEASDLLNENPGALENYKKAMMLDADLTELYTPLGVLYYQNGEIAEADSYLTKALAVSADNAETQLFLGLVRYKQDKNDEASKAFRRAVELDPTSAEAHYYLGETLDRVNKNNEAIAEYKEAVRLNPKYTEAWFDLGVAYYNSGKYEDAINAYKQTLRLQNNMGEAHANLAEIYREQKRFDDAAGAYRLATTFIKDDAELYSKFGYVAGRIATQPGRQNNWNVAIENLTKALAISSDYIDYTNLGWAYYNSALTDLNAGRKADADAKLLKAKTNLLEAVKINQKFPATYLNLGITQTDLGEYKNAVESLKRADNLRKDWIPAINELGIAYRKLNDYDNAAKQFRRATEIDGNFVTAYYNLGESEFQRKNIKEAKKAYQKLLELNTARSKYLAVQLELITKGAVRN
jgi:tetratricopeptide (TPR) repeat protein